MNRKVERSKGQTTVEFALVATTFFLLLFGIFEVTRLAYGFNSVSNGAREGARWAIAVSNNPNPNPPPPPALPTTTCVTGNPGLTAAAQAQMFGMSPAPVITAVQDPASPPAYCEVTVKWAFQPLTGGLDKIPSFSVISVSRQYYN
jgi:hypothetical protein